MINASAKIWRVNNTGVPADFTTAQAAINSVSVVNGDTIHLEASGASYGSMNITKQLVIIGRTKQVKLPPYSSCSDRP